MGEEEDALCWPQRGIRSAFRKGEVISGNFITAAAVNTTDTQTTSKYCSSISASFLDECDSRTNLFVDKLKQTYDLPVTFAEAAATNLTNSSAKKRSNLSCADGTEASSSTPTRNTRQRVE